MKTNSEIKLALVDCYRFAATIKTNKFYKSFTSSNSIFGNEITQTTRSKIITDFRFQAYQALGRRTDDIEKLKTLLHEGADMVATMANNISDYYRFEMLENLPSYESYCPTIDLNNTLGVLNEISQYVYRIETFKAQNYLAELCRAAKAVHTINYGIDNVSFNNLVRKLLTTKDYFKSGYPKDLLCYDAWSVENKLAKSIWYRPEYCSTYLDQGEKCPDPDLYVEWPITY